MWNYIKFIAYIQWKEPTEYTGIESYIFEKWENNDLSWYFYKFYAFFFVLNYYYYFVSLNINKKRFPLNKARELDDKRYEEDE